jgi:hypothetical protein
MTGASDVLQPFIGRGIHAFDEITAAIGRRVTAGFTRLGETTCDELVVARSADSHLQ